MWHSGEQGDRGHDEPGDAVPALSRREVNKRLLHRMQYVAGGKTFDRGEVTAGHASDRCQASPQRLTVNKHGACTT